jgi:hypothetical protein
MAKRVIIEIFMVMLIGIVLGLFGPFGSYAMPTALRLIYWLGFVVAGYAIFRPIIIVGRWLAEMIHIDVLIGIGLALLLAAVPMTFLVAWAFSGFVARIASWSEGLGLLYLQVLLIGFLINGFFMLMFREPADPVAAPATTRNKAPPPVPQVPTSFADRLPPGFGPLLALNSEDHYVRAIGESREELILIRLRDAVAELANVDGLQVHRSWWVARAAIAATRREGRTATLTLTTGRDVPVSREAMAAVRAAGWF